LYLARKKIRGRTSYFIRESFRRGGKMLSRQLMDLGEDPWRFIEYPGGNAFYISEEVQETLGRAGRKPDYDELEKLFLPFLDPEIRRVLEPFLLSEEAKKTKHKITAEQERQIVSEVHGFDKRRLFFLKFANPDNASLKFTPVKVFRPLLEKSRDELEQYFLLREHALSPNEYKLYAFSAFNMQSRFPGFAARKAPQMLDHEHLDQAFLEEICFLNKDEDFWAGEKTGPGLHEYLRRYLIMFFDYEFPQPTYFLEFLYRAMGQRRFYGPVERTSARMEDLSRELGVGKDELRRMSRKDLIRLYRRLAHKHHPDKGGDSKKFIRVTEAYHVALRLKKNSQGK